MSSLDPLFRPRSVAVIGASTDPAKIGGRPVAYLLRAGYAGRILPVNPNAPEVQGLPAFASLDAVPGEVDLAVVTVPAAAVPAAIEACIRKRVRAVVMFSAGYAETGEAGRAAQAALVARCREGGIRLLGPNALGLMNPGDGVYATFSASLHASWPKPGRVAIATQSGAVGTWCFTLLADRGAGISHLVTTGNEGDVDVAACIDWLADDPATGVILTYLEGARDGARLLAALEKCRARGKPVVAMKVGTSEVGAAATESHTGTLAGADAGYAAAFQAAGAWRAGSLAEAADIAAACTAGPLPRGRSVGIVTISGGAGAFLADAAAAQGFDVPALPEEAQAELRAVISFAGTRNPVDTTAQVANEKDAFGRMLEIMLRHGRFDMLVGFLAFLAENPARLDPALPALKRARQAWPLVPFLFGMRAPVATRAMLLQMGIAGFDDPNQAMQAATALAWLGEQQDRRLPGLPSPAPRALPDGPLDEAACRALLSEAGLPFAPSYVAHSAEEACDAAAALGWPVVLKVLSPNLAHKSEAGGVRLDLCDAAGLRAAWDSMLAEVRERAPQARVNGALVSPMLRGGVEVVLGMTRDPVFGPLLMFGLGGVFVEVLRDVGFRLAPLTRDAALDLIRSVKGFPLLDGARGRPKVDLGAIADALVALSRFAEAHPEAAGVEVNPFLALPEGGFGLDAVILRATG
ncbi:acetate--CoA ligase family protein [Paracraurococcus ruber]|nr:acetate--CoA ligase family protein [Paracraurococcus ruber]